MYQFDAEKLPSASGAFRRKVFRLHDVAMVLWRTHLVVQNLSPAAVYGCKISDSAFIQI